MLKQFHAALHRYLDTRTKKALALTIVYALAYVTIYGALPPSDSIVVTLTGSREAARHVGDLLMHVLFWITLAVVGLIAVLPARATRSGAPTRRT